MSKIKYYVYALIDPRNNKIFYIGKGHDNRANWHLLPNALNTRNNKNCRKTNKVNAIYKKGLTPKIKYLYENIADEDKAYKLEDKLIRKYGRKGYEKNGILMNICIGNRPPNVKGKTYQEIYGDRAEEQRELRRQKQIRAGGYGPKKHSEESKLKMKGRIPWNKGISLTNKTKRKISIANKGKFSGKNNPTARKINLIDPNKKIYFSHGELRKTCKKLNLSYSTVYNALRYNRIPNSGPAKGWRFEYLN